MKDKPTKSKLLIALGNGEWIDPTKVISVSGYEDRISDITSRHIEAIVHVRTEYGSVCRIPVPSGKTAKALADELAARINKER